MIQLYYVLDETHTEFQTILQAELDQLADWFTVNKLSISFVKTNYMLFTGIRSSFKKDSLYLTLHDVVLDQPNNCNYLGLYVDKHLSFELHVNNVCTVVRA